MKTANAPFGVPQSRSLEPSRPKPIRVCSVMRDAFDPFDFDEGKLATHEEQRAARAIAACEGCQLLNQCRQETSAVLKGTSTRASFPPVGVVQAGVLFDEESKPYSPPTVKPMQGTLDLQFKTGSPVNKSDWNPPQATERVNRAAVRAALSDEALERTVTARYLKIKRISPASELRMVLSEKEERVVIHEGLLMGVTRWRICTNLRTRWVRVDELAAKYKLGTDEAILA